MRTHAKTARNRLEGFLLLANAVAASPPPGAVHERTVSRIHQPDDGGIHAAGQGRGEMRKAIVAAVLRQFRHRRQRAVGRRTPFGVGEIGPDVTVAFLAREAAGKDAAALQLRVVRDGGNDATLAGMRVETPAVVGAFDGLPVIMAKRKREGAVGADVAQGKRFAFGVASENERDLEALRSYQPSAAYFLATQDRVPKPQRNSPPSEAVETGRAAFARSIP